MKAKYFTVLSLYCFSKGSLRLPVQSVAPEIDSIIVILVDSNFEKLSLFINLLEKPVIMV